MKKSLFFTGSLVAVLGAGGFYLSGHLKTPKEYEVADVSQWRPDSPRHALPVHPVLGINDTFRSLHGSTRNSDEVLTATAPKVELDWVAEEHLFIAEGPSIDREGHLYFSPIAPSESVVLVSLDKDTGERRWAIPGKPMSAGGGTPLVLDDPDNPGEQIIYLTLYERALAVKPDGTIIWDVETGIREPVVQSGDKRSAHNFGANYHPQSDTIVGIVEDGKVFVLDRKTGAPMLSEPFVIPGAPAKGDDSTRPGEWLTERTDEKLKEVFGEDPAVGGRFSRVLDILGGRNVKIANYFSINPESGRMMVAATAPDEKDGTVDGASENGALYGIDMQPDGSGKYRLSVTKSAFFKGGTGSTPAIRADGKRVYVSDDNGNVIAFDMELNKLWQQSVGEQILASITVASENNELYAITAGALFKLKDNGDSGELVWAADLDMFPEKAGHKNMNLLTASVTANGIAVVLGGGFEKGAFRMPISIGVGLLDRETGKVISYAPGIEESVSTTTVGPDGGYYLAHSPIRRAVSSALFGPLIDPMTGGISRYKPIQNDVLLRDAVCAASVRLENASQYIDSHPLSSEADVIQAEVLMRQAGLVLENAFIEGVMNEKERDALKLPINSIDTKNVHFAMNQTKNLCDQLKG
ncbi:PQQ-binding-like beta-propeller repeat protein [uncultured Endozoicomonas sp.]|uniref:outer membrane protein assembly factor BamB family protein n=1 Tax=uncultured Endozoicomonas sp. TaxID=432652 RepID=UPI00260C25A2|nr:PQQ-binding-like beta-propeller repeat protein [uncultured Endozoicomonas sp.]